MARDPYKYFRVEARDLADQLGQSLLELERVGSGGEVVPRLLRLAHTLKGAARVVRLVDIADQAHRIEDLLTPYRDQTAAVPRSGMDALLLLLDGIAERVSALGSAPSQLEAGPANRAVVNDLSGSPRAEVSDIDRLLDGLSETNTQLSGLRDVVSLVVRVRHLSDQIFEQLAVAARGGDNRETNVAEAVASTETLRLVSASIERSIVSTHNHVDRELRQLRDVAEQMRLVPAGVMFANFERAARDSAQVLGKEIIFGSEGGDIRLDTHVARLVQDAVLQLVRNAVAHGVEARRDRVALGKPPAGRVFVRVVRRGRQIVFCCEDDGRGIDVAGLREAAIRKGRTASELDRLDTDDLVHLLLQGGISTSAAVSEVAGRGIGMDIVRETVARLGAQFRVITDAGKRTRFELTVPLSVSSVESLLLEAAGVRATLPLYAIRHTLRLAANDIYRSSLGETIIHEGVAIPLVSLSWLVGRETAARRAGNGLSAVVVGTASGVAAIAVNRLPGTANIIFRSLPDLAPATAVVAGASLDADGVPLLMLDPEGIIATALGRDQTVAQDDVPKHPLLVIDDSLTTRMLEQSILESAGYEVDVAVSAEEGLERVWLRDYALILVDVEMPGMDGFGFIEQIRRDPKLRSIPAILVTSRNAPADKRRGQEVGAQGYVVKSEFDQGELLDNIARLVAQNG